MASLYSAEHRAIQEEFGTTKIAELLDSKWVQDAIGENEKAFIQSRDMFFLSTVDPDGNPTVSYKGGSAGFVKVIDANTLAFPGYDGNGMFYSMRQHRGTRAASGCSSSTSRRRIAFACRGSPELSATTL